MESAFKRNPGITTLILLHLMIRNSFCLNLLFITTRDDRLDLVVTNTHRVSSSVDRTITIVRYTQTSSAQEVTDRRKFIKTSVEKKGEKRRFFTIILQTKPAARVFVYPLKYSNRRFGPPRALLLYNSVFRRAWRSGREDSRDGLVR